jgi:hypothetical protein
MASMAAIIVSIVFFAGIAIAVWSALVVAEQNKSKWWYALPSAYSLLVNVADEKINKHGFDVSAIVFFAAALTLIGWGVVRFQLRRDRHLPR